MPSDPAILDPEVQQALREVMRDDYDLLVDTFLADAQMRLTHLQLSLQAQDWAAFRQTAHSFRGSCGNMGAVAMHDACQRAEAAAMAANVAAAESALQSLQDLHQRVTGLLRP